MWLKCVWADCSALMSDCPPQHVNAPSHNERYLGRQADGVPVRRRKLQLPSEDLIEQLLLHIVLTAERKMREKERTTYLSTPLKTPNIKYKTKLSSPLTFWREGIHTAGCRWSLPPPRYPPSDHTYTHTHTQFSVSSPVLTQQFVSDSSPLLPGLGDDLRGDVRRRATHGVQRSFNHRRQTEVAQLQRFGAVRILAHLQDTQTNTSHSSCVFDAQHDSAWCTLVLDVRLVVFQKHRKNNERHLFLLTSVDLQPNRWSSALHQWNSRKFIQVWLTISVQVVKVAILSEPLHCFQSTV